ncbi:hypothetical protein [Actinoplanes sp. NPDC051859]|uniref:hypothetical protein n=1 Tax=Actinoplanes sp. NPDC051859 TaxID=3363909 RepID=UPI00379B81F2
MRQRHLTAVLAAVVGVALTGALAAPAQAAPASDKQSTTTAAHAPEGRGPGGRGPGDGGGRDGQRPVEDRGPADEDDSASEFRAGGTVTAVDSAAATITLSHPGANGAAEEETIAVAADATVTVDEDDAALGDVPVGARVRLSGTVTVDEEDEDAEEVRTADLVEAVTSWDLRLGGTVSAVDSAASTLTLVPPAARKGAKAATAKPVTVTVGSGAKVTLDRKTATLADVVVGATVQVSGTEGITGQTVTKVEAKSAVTVKKSTRKAKKKSGKR